MVLVRILVALSKFQFVGVVLVLGSLAVGGVSPACYNTVDCSQVHTWLGIVLRMRHHDWRDLRWSQQLPVENLLHSVVEPTLVEGRQAWGRLLEVVGPLERLVEQLVPLDQLPFHFH